MRVRGRFRTRLKKPHTTERFLTMTRRLLSATLGVAALASVSIVFPARAATLKVDDDGALRGPPDSFVARMKKK